MGLVLLPRISASWCSWCFVSLCMYVFMAFNLLSLILLCPLLFFFLFGDFISGNDLRFILKVNFTRFFCQVPICKTRAWKFSTRGFRDQPHNQFILKTHMRIVLWLQIFSKDSLPSTRHSFLRWVVLIACWSPIFAGHLLLYFVPWWALSLSVPASLSAVP